MRTTLLLTGLLLALAVPATAGQRPDRYLIPGDEVFPEGIARDGKAFFVGSTTDGTLFRGDVRERRLEVLSPGGAGGRTTAVGLEVLRDGRLLVAGGATGRLFVVDAATGEPLGDAAKPGDGPSFLNDVAVSGRHAYVTDSITNEVLRRPLAGGPLEPWVQLPDRRPGFNANGIVATPDGQLVVVQSTTGALWRVGTTDGAVRRIDTGGAVLTGGDGLELHGRTLWVVRNQQERIVPLRLDGRLRSARAGEALTSPALRFPTTTVRDGGRLLVVNAQFDRRGGTPELPFDVVAVDAPRP